MSSHSYFDHHGMYGLMAEFKHPEELVKAAHRAYSTGFRKMEGYSPLPVVGLSEALGHKRHFVSLVVLMGGLTGCIGGFTPIVSCNVIASPRHLAGDPHDA